MSVSEARRQSDEERSRKTREQILKAAIACLIEDGYAAASIGAIQARAGISRGALQHQYASKAELLVDAVHLLSEEQIRLFKSEARGAGKPHVDWLDALWSAFANPVFGAVLELWVAARTDEDLRRVLASQQRQIHAVLRDVVASCIDGALPPKFNAVFNMSLAYYRGVALTSVLSTKHRRELLEQWREAVRQLL